MRPERLLGAPLVSSVVFLGLALGQAGGAAAANYRVSPTRVTLSPPANSAVLTIINESDEPMRFQVSAGIWSEGPNGAVVVTPSDEVVFFPALLSVGALEQKNIRIGTTAPVGEVERTYRVIVQELPPLKKPQDQKLGATVRILTKMSIPVYWGPLKPAPAWRLLGPGVEQGTVRFGIENTGNVHISVLAVKIHGYSSGDEAIVEREAEGWYILAGRTREYQVPLTSEECARLRRVSVDVQTEADTHSATAEIASGGCTSPPRPSPVPSPPTPTGR